MIADEGSAEAMVMFFGLMILPAVFVAVVGTVVFFAVRGVITGRRDRNSKRNRHIERQAMTTGTRRPDDGERT